MPIKKEIIYSKNKKSCKILGTGRRKKIDFNSFVIDSVPAIKSKYIKEILNASQTAAETMVYCPDAEDELIFMSGKYTGKEALTELAIRLVRNNWLIVGFYKSGEQDFCWGCNNNKLFFTNDISTIQEEYARTPAIIKKIRDPLDSPKFWRTMLSLLTIENACQLEKI